MWYAYLHSIGQFPLACVRCAAHSFGIARCEKTLLVVEHLPIGLALLPSCCSFKNVYLAYPARQLIVQAIHAYFVVCIIEAEESSDGTVRCRSSPHCGVRDGHEKSESRETEEGFGEKSRGGGDSSSHARVLLQDNMYEHKILTSNCLLLSSPYFCISNTDYCY